MKIFPTYLKYASPMLLKKIQEENLDYKGDLGFKVFKLDSSNIKRWKADFDAYKKICSIPLIISSRIAPAKMYELS